MNHVMFAGEPKTRAMAWVWLIEEAAWQPREVKVRGGTVSVERGQLAVSQRALAAEWGWSRTTLQRFLEELESAGMISVVAVSVGPLSGPRSGPVSGPVSSSSASVITICNYSRYQAPVTAVLDESGPLSGPARGPLVGPSVQGIKEERGVVYITPRTRAPETPAVAPMADAVALIRAFDDARAAAWGEALRRPWPNALDSTTAQRMLAAAAEAGLDGRAAIQAFTAMVGPAHLARASAGHEPPNTLSFHARQFGELLRTHSRPIEVAHGRTHTAASYSRNHGGDGSTARAAAFDVVFGPRVEGE